MQYLQIHGEATTKQISEAINDVPAPALYRHINTLRKEEVLTVKEERITISGTVSIGATATCTDKNALSPAIVVIMGTGKTDRDGNGKGFRTDLYRQFAEFFSGKEDAPE